jgi:hypothetical protein
MDHNDLEELSSFDPTLADEEAIAQACVTAEELSKGEQILKYLVVARGLEVISKKAQKTSHSTKPKGKQYNRALAAALKEYPELADVSKGPQLSGAVYVVQNWDAALPRIKAMTHGQLANFNFHSLRVAMQREAKELKDAETGKVKEKKLTLRDELEDAWKERDDLREENKALRRFSVVDNDPRDFVAFLASQFEAVAIEVCLTQFAALIEEMQRYVETLSQPEPVATGDEVDEVEPTEDTPTSVVKPPKAPRGKGKSSPEAQAA